MHSGTKYALQYIKQKIGDLAQSTSNLNELKDKVIEAIDEFIMERIVYAQDLLINQGVKIISDKREEVIMIYGNQESQSVQELIKKAVEIGRNLRVIVVDSAPDFHGRSIVKRLAKCGIKCQYTLISMVNFLINQVTKVFLSASYVLCNGALVAPMGSSMIGCIASKHQIPVVAICETYKFEDRVNLDQINNNEQGDSNKFINNYLRKNCPNKDSLDEILSK